MVRDLASPPAGDGLNLHFQLHFGSRVNYDVTTGQWWPLEDALAVPTDLLVLQRMKTCLAQVTPWPPSLDVVQAVAAQCGVMPVKLRRRVTDAQSPSSRSSPEEASTLSVSQRVCGVLTIDPRLVRSQDSG